MTSFAGLPAVLREIAEAAGISAALALAESYGGTRRMIPASVTSDHWLAQCVGLEAARKICDLYRQQATGERPFGQELLIPLGPTGGLAAARQRMLHALGAGASARDAARAAGLHERTVYRARRKLKRDRCDEQGELMFSWRSPGKGSDR